MNVRTLIRALLNVDMDDSVGVIRDGKFYPVRLVSERNDSRLRLGITDPPPFEGQLDVLDFKTLATVTKKAQPGSKRKRRKSV